MVVKMISLRLFLMILVGVLCGLTTGVIGASGVMLVVSFLHLLLGFSMYAALGVSLGVDLILAATTTSIYYRHGNVDLGKGVWMLLSALIGVQLGSRIAIQTPEARLQFIFAVFLFISGGFLIKGGFNKVNTLKNSFLERYGIPPINQWQKTYQIVISIVVGFIIGILCGFQGAGGGLMFLTALVIIFDFSIHKAVGTSTLMMMTTAGSGFVTFAFLGFVNWQTILILSISAVFTNLVSANKCNQLPEDKLKRIGGIIFLLIAILMFLTNFY